MRLRSILKLAPYPIKHPLITFTRWIWGVRGLPAQSPKDMKVLKELLTSARGEVVRVWEWGAGRSTIYYPKFLQSLGKDFEWHAVDNSSDWYAKCKKNLEGTSFSDRVHMYCREFSAFWQLPDYADSDPVPPVSFNESSAVTEYINLPADIGGQFDVIIIDGRYRRRCLLMARNLLAPGGTVYLHDAQKEWYHPSLSSYDCVKFEETGNLPGTKQKSSIALCSVNDESWSPMPD